MHIPEDSVPYKIRAKRGCASHPRSIAERVGKLFIETGHSCMHNIFIRVVL